MGHDGYKNVSHLSVLPRNSSVQTYRRRCVWIRERMRRNDSSGGGRVRVGPEPTHDAQIAYMKTRYGEKCAWRAKAVMKNCREAKEEYGSSLSMMASEPSSCGNTPIGQNLPARVIFTGVHNHNTTPEFRPYTRFDGT